MDSSPIISPPITFKQKAVRLVSRHKNLILIALILVISLFDVGLFLSKQGVNLPLSSKSSTVDEKKMLATTQSTLCPGGGTRQCIYDDAGKQECYDYCYNGTTIDVQNPPPTLPPQDTNKVIQDAVNNTSNLCAQQDNSCTLQGCTPTSKGNSCGACDCTRRITPTDLRPLLTPTATPQPTAVPPTSTPAPIKKVTPTELPCYGGDAERIGYGLEPCPVTVQPTKKPDNIYIQNPDIYKPTSTPIPTPTPTSRPCNVALGRNAYDKCVNEQKKNNTPTPSKEKQISPVTSWSIPEPSETRATIAVYTQGLGTNTGLGQNSNPIRAQDLQIQILDSQNNILKEGLISLLAKQVSGQLPTNVGFEQLISLGKDLPAGNYQTRVKLDNTLWKTINANLTPGSQTSLPPLELVLGDIDQDNQISLVDYNMLISCFGQNICTQKIQADLNLDGKIDETDLNLLYNSFKTRLGQ